MYVNMKSYEISITHIFPEDPIEQIIDALMSLIQGEKKREFNLYDEPGGVRITIEEIPTKQHMVLLQVDEFSEDYGQKVTNYRKIISFEIKKTQLICMFYFEFKKIAVLMKDRHFAENRQGEFPLGLFMEFEKLATDFIDAK